MASEPKLSIRSARARALAHDLSARTGRPINTIVEEALERYERELHAEKAAHPLDAVWALAAEGRRNVPPGTTSNHDDFYDEHGLPK